MIVNQTNAANQGQNHYTSIAPFKNSRRVLSACVVAGIIISFVHLSVYHKYILTTISPAWNTITFWILQTIVFFLDGIALVISGETYTCRSIHRFCSVWATVLIFQILNVVCYTNLWIVWISDDGSSATIVLTWVKFAIFVVILILSIILFRKLQRINNTIRYSNFDPAIVATNITDRGQVAIIGRRPQNRDYLAQLSVVSENLYNNLPPKYEDLDQPPTYEESLQLQRQE